MADKTDEYVLIPCPHCGSTDTQFFVKQTAPASSWWIPVVLVLIGIIAAVTLGPIGLGILVVAAIIAIVVAVAGRKGKVTETWRCNDCKKSFVKK